MIHQFKWRTALQLHRRCTETTLPLHWSPSLFPVEYRHGNQDRRVFRSKRGVVPMMWILLGVFLSGAALGAFVVLVIGIYGDEHRMSLKADPHTPASSSARRALTYVRQPNKDITKFAI